MMRNKLILNGRTGEHHELIQQCPGKYSLESNYIGLTLGENDNEILAVDPPGGPYITVGFKFRFRHKDYRVVSISRLNEPLLIEIEEVDDKPF